MAAKKRGGFFHGIGKGLGFVRNTSDEDENRDDPQTTRGALSHNYSKNLSPLEEMQKLVNKDDDFFEHFHLGDKISNGAFGAVYEVRAAARGASCACLWLD